MSPFGSICIDLGHILTKMRESMSETYWECQRPDCDYIERRDK